MKYKSCDWIENGINFDTDSYKICCNYSSKGGGNTIIQKNYKGGKIDWNKVFDFKNRIKQIHKSGGTYKNCEGCIFLKDKDWNDKHTKICFINLDYWTKCNSRCIYCHTMKDKNKYNSYKNYHFLPILKDMIKRDILRPYGHVSFGGGEVTLLDEFEEILDLLLNFGFKHIKIHTSGIIYSKAIENGLRNGCIDLIISVDSGTKEKHREIKGVDSYNIVWENIKKYAKTQNDPNSVKTKYILVPGINDSKEEIDLWLKKSKDNGINFVLHEIESKWFYERRENVDDSIIKYFDYAKEKAEELGLIYELYERAKHMISYNKNLETENE